MTDAGVRKLECQNCGAPLDPATAREGVVACQFCGTANRLPDSPPAGGGVQIVADGSIFIGGSIVGGDLIVNYRPEAEPDADPPPPAPPAPDRPRPGRVGRVRRAIRRRLRRSRG